MDRRDELAGDYEGAFDSDGVLPEGAGDEPARAALDAGGSAEPAPRPWYANALAAVALALIVAGLISGAAALVGRGDQDDVEARLERLVEARTAALLADARDHLD